MKREIYEVYAKVIDANGAYNTLTGYPKVFDSHSYNDDIAITEKRAYGAYYEVLGAMCKRDDRQQQIAMIIRGSDGYQIMYTHYGAIADIPDPTYTLTIEGGSGSGSYYVNNIVPISANLPAEGKQFSHWEGLEGIQITRGDENSSSIMIVMPKRNLTLTAIFEDIEEESEP